MNYKQLQNELKNRVVSSAYLFVCTDSYIAESYVKLIRDNFVNKEFLSMNLTVVDEEKISPEELRAEFDKLPLMSDRRLILIRPNAFDSINKSNAFVKVIENYLKSPNEYCTLIAMTDKADKRLKMYKTFEENAKVVEFDKLPNAELAAYIQNTFTKKKINISKEALDIFIKAMDYNNRESNVDLGYVVNEIDKLCFYIKGKKNITAQDVKDVVSPNITKDMFRYTDSLLMGNIKEAYDNIFHLMINKVPFPLLFFNIDKVLRENAICKSAFDKGMKDFQISKKYAIHNFVVKKYINDSKISAEKSLLGIKFLSLQDAKLKSGEIKPELAMDIITQYICSLS